MSDESLHTVPASHGRALRLQEGQAVKLINTHGSQVVDTWAFDAGDVDDYMSMEISRRLWLRLMPKVGDLLFTNRRDPILAFAEDSSPGIHDTLFACCDRFTYEKLERPGHRSCAQNLAEALEDLGLEIARAPNPLNLFMNIPVRDNVALDIQVPVSRPGDFVTLRAERDCVVAFSACPMDVLPINGADCTPRDVHYAVLG